MRATAGWIALTASGLLLGCSPAAVRTPPASADVGTRPPVLRSEGGAEAVGGALAAELGKHLGGTPSGLTAVGWNPEDEDLRPLGAGLAAGLPKALTLAESGVSARGAPEALSQLDPASFSALLWLSPERTPEGALSSLLVEVRRGPAAVSLRFEIRPPLASSPPPRTVRGQEPSAVIASIEGPIRALTWEEGPPARLWVLGEDILYRMDPSDGTVVQHWKRETSGGLASLVWAEGLPPRLALLEPHSGRGRWFEREADGTFSPDGPVEGFPLGERAARFLSAEWDPEGGAFLLYDYAGKDLGTFVQMARPTGPEGSQFVLLGPDGTTTAVRGSDLARFPGPAGGVTALSAAGPALILSTGEPPPRVEAFVLSRDRLWEVVWTSPPLEVAPGATCAVQGGGSIRVFVGISRSGRGFVLSFSFPLPVPSP